MVTTPMTRAMFTVVMTIVSVFAIPSMILTSGVVASVSAQSASSPLLAEQIKVSREISAPIDQVWNIVSNIDEETKYWPIIKDIKNINKTNNMVDREVTIGVGPTPSWTQDTKTRQFVTLSPDQKLIQTNITEGPVTGTRVLTLNSISDSNATRIDVVWDLDMNNIPVFARGFAKDNFMTTTEEALGKIAQAVK
jgi:ribosome-associated toxin RatA of RatAB toxin-antitoxin module